MADLQQDDDINRLILGVGSKESAAPSKEIKSAFDVNQTYGTPPKLLDNLGMVESSNDPYALNKDTKALGNYQFTPETLVYLHKKGIKFNPLDPKESRAAADWYLNDLAQSNNGDYKKALTQYGGFKTKDPTEYVNKALNGVDLSQNKPQTQTQSQDQFQTNDNQDDINKLILGSSGNIKAEQQQTFPSNTSMDQFSKEAWNKRLGRMTEEEKQKLKENEKRFLQGTASVLDTTLGIVPGVINQGTYAIERALQKSPEEAQKIAERVSSPLENPIGRLFGVTETPGYKGEASRVIMGKAGEFVGKSSKEISDKTGIPQADVENMIQSGLIAVGPKVSKIAGNVAGGIIEDVTKRKPTVDVNVEIPKTGESAKAIDISKNEQILKDVGIKNIRDSSVTGNQKDAASQYLTAKASKGIYGEKMTDQLNHEKESLNNHFSSIENDLGGTIPRTGTEFETTDKIEAGNKIRNAAEESLNEHNQKTTELYTKAKQEFGDKPVELGKLNEFLKGDENFTYTQEQNLQKGIQNFLKRKQLLNESGNVKPMTIGQSEELRQFINSKYNYETKNLGGQLKGLIDDDVFSSVGGETFETARKHFQVGKEIYENPKAMSDLLNVEGTNQKIPTEDIIKKVVTLPESQFEHMINVFKDTGKVDALNQIKTSLINRIKEAGQSASNEPWNGVASAKEMAKLSEKLRVAFEDDPKTLNKLLKGIEAGKLVSINTKYPGAAVQTHILQNKLVGMASKAGSILGWKAGPIGSMATEHVAGKLEQKLSQSKQIKQINKEIKYHKLSDIGK
jgi:hypothetical protein